ncbi:MAG: hypothetical protein PUE84_01385 [Firmicutes bacterium]|nr:hypothetical protein [Bacillota bacterium]
MLENKCSQIDYTRKTSKREGKNRSKKWKKVERRTYERKNEQKKTAEPVEIQRFFGAP